LTIIMESILYACLICLHLFDAGFQGPKLDHRDSKCNECLNQLFKEPELNSNLHYIEKFAKDKQLSFDDLTLPFLRGTIEEKIDYAYKSSKAYDPKTFLLSGAVDMTWFHNDKLFFNIMREVYQYEKDVKRFLEGQKQATMKKIDQKNDEVVLDLDKIWKIDELSGQKKVSKEAHLAIFRRMKQEEARKSAEVLVMNEKMNIMREYSKVISDFYIQLANDMYKPKDNDQGFWQVWSALKEKILPAKQNCLHYDHKEDLWQAWGALNKKAEARKMPDEHPGFEEIFLKFEKTFEELLKEFSMVRDGNDIDDVSLLFEKFDINSEEYYSKMLKLIPIWEQNGKPLKELSKGEDL